MKPRSLLLIFLMQCIAPLAAAPVESGVWLPDRGDGTYANPVLNGDYSDPDVVRVGDDYYLTASSFTNVPGWPVDHAATAGCCPRRHRSVPVLGRRRPGLRTATSTGPKPWYITEGPKLYKRHGWYYIFAPTDSVKGGFQGVFRARSIAGPYEGRNVLDQGSTAINGPHQGAWVSTAAGADHAPSTAPVVSDDFGYGFHAGWQWNANPQDDWADVAARPGFLRLKSVSSSANLWEAGNLLTQKLPGQTFTVTVKMSLSARWQGERAGLLVYGYNYGWIGLQNTVAGLKLIRVTRLKANAGGAEHEVIAAIPVTGEVYLRVHLEPVTVAETVPDFPDYWPANVSTRIGWADFDDFIVAP